MSFFIKRRGQRTIVARDGAIATLSCGHTIALRRSDLQSAICVACKPKVRRRVPKESSGS